MRPGRIFIVLLLPVSAFAQSLQHPIRNIVPFTPAVQANVRNLTTTVAYEDDETFAKFLAVESVRWKATLAALDFK